MRESTRHVISLDDLTDDDLWAIVTQGTRYSLDTLQRRHPLADAVVGVFFRKTSTRTRTAFSTAALRLGAQLVTFGPDDLQLNTGETVEDTGRVLAGMLDVLVARTAADPEELRAYAEPGGMSVVNAMTTDEHPTQALTDLTTLLCRFRRLEDLRVLYVGEGNNTAAALALGLSRFRGVELELRTPPGYGLPEPVRARAAANAARAGARVTEHHDMTDVPGGLDAIYTARWQTTGTSKPDPDWRAVFAPFRVTADLWRGSPDAVFMHDLPAHRGEEVTAEVLDGPASIAFEQARNKMHSAMAVLEWCRLGRYGMDTPVAAAELAGARSGPR